MAYTSVRFPNACAVECVAINTEKGGRGSDPPLTHEHFPCACRTVARIARKRIVEALLKYPIRDIWRDTHRPRTDDELRAFAIARSVVAKDEEILRELNQELICQLSFAIQRGRVQAAKPALCMWVRRVSYRLVRRYAKEAMKIAIASTGLVSFVNSVDDEACSRVSAGGDTSPEVRDMLVECLKRRPEILRRLSKACHTVLLRWLSGDRPGEIARDLGISRVAASLRLMRAKRLIVA